MADINASIRHNAAGLARFSGRDTRAQYWPWTLILIVLQMVASGIAAGPMMSHMMNRFATIFTAASRGQKLAPEAVDAQMQGMMTTMTADMRTMIFVGIAINLVFLLLVLAATVRRLHDRGWSGWWALLPLPFQAVGAAIAPRMLEGMAMPRIGASGPFVPAPADPGLMALSMLNSLAFYCALGFLLFLLVTEGTRGPNRYGGDPLARTPA
jgi:uncharacterized membrane protein YhaH (DUF805 family)